jgi:hypothetical protein
MSTTPLTWEASVGAATYHVQVANSTAFTTTVVNDSTLTATTRNVGVILASGGDYYWRVRAKNVSGVSGWTTTRRFTAAVIIAVLPGKLSLSRLPGTEGGAIRFGLPQRGRVVLRLYDTQGRLVASLLDEIREAGYHSVPLPKGTEGGIYLIDLRADGVRSTMVLQP